MMQHRISTRTESSLDGLLAGLLFPSTVFLGRDTQNNHKRNNTPNLKHPAKAMNSPLRLLPNSRVCHRLLCSVCTRISRHGPGVRVTFIRGEHEASPRYSPFLSRFLTTAWAANCRERVGLLPGNAFDGWEAFHVPLSDSSAVVVAKRVSWLGVLGRSDTGRSGRASHPRS